MFLNKVLSSPKATKKNRDGAAIVIGKTFEATTLADGSQQVLATTRYRRLNDGYIWTESNVIQLSEIEDVMRNTGVEDLQLKKKQAQTWSESFSSVGSDEEEDVFDFSLTPSPPEKRFVREQVENGDVIQYSFDAVDRTPTLTPMHNRDRGAGLFCPTQSVGGEEIAVHNARKSHNYASPAAKTNNWDLKASDADDSVVIIDAGKEQRKRRCMVLFASFCLVIVGVLVATLFVLKPWAASSASPCIQLKIIIEVDESTDITTWSLTRLLDDDSTITIGAGDSISVDDPNTFDKCVSPGVYTFHVSDSGGDGLGERSKTGYVVNADGIDLGVSSWFYHDEKMTFSLPLVDETDTGICTDDFLLVIKTDNKPEEMYWDVVDNQNGETVLKGGPYSLPLSIHTHRACLPDGNFTFNMHDSGSDGVCCDDGKGFFSLYKDGVEVVDSNGKFGDNHSTMFVLGNHTSP